MKSDEIRKLKQTDPGFRDWFDYYLIGRESLSEAVLQSKPPTGKCKVTNLYIDPGTGKLTVEYEDTPI